MRFWRAVALPLLLAGWTNALVIVDNADTGIRFSNGVPSWKNCYQQAGGGHYVILWGNKDAESYKASWHEVFGKGASASLTFTGTRVILNGTVARSYWNTTVDLFIDDALVSTLCMDNFDYLTTMADIGNLPPGEHTFRAVSATDDTLFVLDSISYEPSDPAPASTGATRSITSTGSPAATGSPSSSIVSTTTASSNSTATSSLTTTASQTSTLSSGDEGPVLSMDVLPSNSSIVYTPANAWKENAPNGDSNGCTGEIKSSSTSGSYLSYNFTGSSIELYSVSKGASGRYSIWLDGSSHGTYDTQLVTTTNPDSCSPVLLFKASDLTATQHTIRLVIEDPAESNDINIPFAGIRLAASPITTNGASPASTHKSNTAAIVGGVVGGIIGLILLVILLFFLQRRYTFDERRDDSESSGIDPFLLRPSDADALPKTVLPTEISETATHDPSLSEHGQEQGHEDLSINPRSSEDHNQQPIMKVNNNYPITRPADPPVPQRPQRQVPVNPADQLLGDRSSLVDHATVYTLPSYNEQMFQQRAEARDLSEADINAISRRLGQFMRAHGEQHGSNTNADGRGDAAPRELIDRLVDERLRAREGQ
ncbi:hypothetical protein CPB86DRAFT_779942 [Serendipita vermifera]|nr:hypothetical protein CPB86DRAFT_779942 [Serendipita vermifera]